MQLFHWICLIVCFRVSLVECLLHLPLRLYIGTGRNASWFRLSLGILSHFRLECQFYIGLEQTKVIHGTSARNSMRAAF